MANSMDQAAVAFDNEGKAPAPSSKRGNDDSDGFQMDALFSNLDRGNEVDEDSPPVAGGDADNTDEVLYGKAGKADPRDPRKEDGSDSDGDDDEGEGGEDESDDGDDDSDEEGAEAEEAEGLGDEILNRKVEVTVDGEPAEVTIKEALEGYVRTQTFHQRMNQLDEAKKIVRRAAADAVHNYEYSMNVAQQMEEHMKTMIPPEPDWDAEFQKDPVKAREMQRYYDKAKTFQAQLKAQTAEARKKMEESNHAQLQAFAEEEHQKFEAANRKSWSDPKKKAKDLVSMRKTGLAQGFSEDELSQVYDSRMLMVLLKASKYDRMMAAKPKPVVRPQGKPVAPGAGSAKERTAQRRDNSAMKRLNRTGSLEDAAVVFDQILARG
jgi:hypothetical protein